MGAFAFKESVVRETEEQFKVECHGES